MTAYERLLELQQFIEAQIHVETCRPTYNGTQRALAYKRVLTRLKPIVKSAGKVRQQFYWALVNDKDEVK